MLKRTLALGALTLAALGAVTATAAPLKICAVTQTWGLLEDYRQQAGQELDIFYAPISDLYSRIANPGPEKCEVLISSEERLPVEIIRQLQGEYSDLSPFARAPLILWSPDPRLFQSQLGALSLRQLNSLALPDAQLTPVGYAAEVTLEKTGIDLKSLRSNLYRTDQEYQAYALTEQGHTQCGFITRPLLHDLREAGQTGSYWLVPQNYYPPLYYYSLILNGADRKAAEAFVNGLHTKNFETLLLRHGFLSNKP